MNGRLFQVGGVAASAFVAGGLAQQAAAAPIPIVNPGFEQITNSGGQPVTLVGGDYTSGMDNTVLNQFRQNLPVMVAGWISENENFAEGVEDQSPALAGTQAYLNAGGSFRQTLARTVQAGTYTLTARIGDSNARPYAPPTMELFNAATGSAYVPVTSLNPAPPDGDYVQWTQTYVFAAPAGNDLGIRFVASGNESHVDDVVLDYIPEPAAMGLLGSAGAGLLWRRRRRRRG